MRRSSWLTLAVLMVLPTIAIYRLPLNGWWLYGTLTVLSASTYLAYFLDKRRAQTNAWRIPELHLHLLELMGGWPGAWVAQGRIRHKSSKTSYQIVFWLIILAYQFVAVETLWEWQICRAAMRQFG
ncbi:MAG: DUF1294 domain-containing protein [Prosthecobacter sp.]